MSETHAAFIPAPPRRRRIFGLALPIVGAMVSQNVLNLVDVAMVGHIPEGANDALAGVNLGSFVHFMAVAFITGLSAGVQAISSRRVGEARLSETALSLNGGLLLAVAIGVPLTAILVLVAPLAFPSLSPNPAISLIATEYFQVRILAMTFVGVNFAFRGYWNGVDRAKLYMATILAMHALNVFLNWIFIYGHLGLPALGGTGAALGTALSTVFGSGIYLWLGARHARGGGFLRGLPSREVIGRMLRVSLPNCLQQFLFASGMTAFIVIIGAIGDDAATAAAPLINLTLVGILPGIAFGLAAATLVGQALGRRDADAATAWGWDVSRLASLVILIVSLPAILAPELLLLPFLADASIRELAAPTLRLIGGTLFIDTLGLVLMNAVIGAGATRMSMFIVSGVQWLLTVPACAIVALAFDGGLFAVWGTFVCTRLAQSMIFVLVWRGGLWQRVRV